MWIDYSLSITESVAELQARERAVRGQRAADRVKLLRLLKSGTARSVRQAAARLGDSERQAQRWWARYTHGGLAALLDVGRPGGSQERITPAAWADLSAQMRAGAIGRLKDAQCTSTGGSPTAWTASRWTASRNCSFVARPS